MNRAGAETMVMNLYRAIDRTEFQFDFLVYNTAHQDYEDEICELGGRVFHFPLKFDVLHCFSSINKIRDLIKKFGPYSNIHIATFNNSAFPLLACLGLRDVKRIVHSHSTSNGLNANVIKRCYNNITRTIIKALSQVNLACGEEAGEYLFGRNFLKEGGIVINNSVDVNRFYYVDSESVDRLRESMGIGCELVIGSVARFHPVKNHRKMIEIAKKLKENNVNFKMIFVGEGDTMPEIKTEVKTYDLENNILFLGTRSDIPELLNTFDVFLMPSIFEGNPVTLIEAQAAGLNCVISDTITDKIDLKLGLIHKCSLNCNIDEWVNIILKAAHNTRPEIEKIRKQFNMHSYDLESNVKLLSEIYRK